VNGSSFFTELKRRNVYKVAVAYAVVGWLVVEIATATFPVLEIPNWATKLVIAVVALGFPIALVLAWAFELTPEGIKKTEDVPPAESIAPRTGRRLWLLTALAAVAAATLFAMGFFFRGGTPPAPRTIPAAMDKSIAVLPLVNQSGDPAQEYFSDGLTEELINGLGQIPELRVIGRNSSFHLKGKGGDSRAIGQELGVAHLLGGSVRKAGDRVRIAVQLVNAADGTQRWSDTYNRELKDIFAVQEEIAKAVAEQLRVRLLGGAPAASSKPSNQNLAAYNAFLQAKYHFEQANPATAGQAIPFLDEAIRLDPSYAEAYVLKARASYFIAITEGLHGRESFEKARAAAKAALALRPDLAGAHAAMAYIYLFADWNLPAVEAELSGVKDKNASVLNNLASLRAIQGRLDESLELRKEVVRLDPLHASYYMNLAQPLLQLGRLDEAEAALRKALELQPAARGAYASLANVALRRGDPDAALREAELETQPINRFTAVAIVRYARGEREQADAALQKLIEEAGDRSPVRIAAVYGFRGEADKMFEWLDRAYEWREPVLISALAMNAEFARYRSDPRLVALCGKIGIPVPK
jgi:TolB-like protein